ncbi:heme o synthase [Pikeienuella sp. HZG-20]|uniref:heme o synthase n=1 Tax=Paludibacillus litoralis TaxID=3133267 RepID=UPI0030EF42F2
MANALDIDRRAIPGDAEFRDYFELLKPRVMSLVIFTALVGLVVAPVPVHPLVAFASILCIAVGAGASGALNMWWDADIDVKMARTRNRPIPTGRIEAGEALALGLGLSLLAIPMLGLFANWLAAGILAFTIFFYAVIYSMWLKRSTPQNIVIGGAAGAFPPMVGWAVATGGVSIESLLMFAIIFFWTPPHFWALALYRNVDYERAAVPMMTVVAGPQATRRQVFWYALLLVAVAIAPAFTSIGGLVYLIAASALSLEFLRLATIVGFRSEAAAQADGHRAEKRLFKFSILWLFLIFSVLALEAGLRAADLSIAAPGAFS